MTTKVGRFSVTQTITTKGKANQIINNANKREATRKLPTWLERVFGYNTPQPEEVRKQLVKQSEKLGKLKTQEILKQIEENIPDRLEFQGESFKKYIDSLTLKDLLVFSHNIFYIIRRTHS